MKQWLKILICSSFIIACGKQQEDLVQADEVTATTEAAITTMSAILDDVEGEGYGANASAKASSLSDILLPTAFADSCIRPATLACNQGQKSSTFDDCSAFASRTTISGNVDLNFSDLNCSMANDGDAVVRTYDYRVSGPRGGTLAVSSASHENYTGQSLGGGAQLVNTNGGWELTILGRHNILSRRGQIVRDKSIRTVQPLTITGDLRRSQRRVSNGQLEVANNTHQFTALYTANNLTWTSTCCHPVSGTLRVEFSGSKTGTGEVAFAGCGSIAVEIDGEVVNDVLTYCD